jgi:hypothetical protein
MHTKCDERTDRGKTICPPTNSRGSIKNIYITYFPKFVKKKSGLQEWSLFIKLAIVQLESKDRFNTACRRPCGAISITIAFAGMCLIASWKSTGLTKLFTR